MSPALCASPIKGRVYRVSKVDACGVPITGGSSAQVVSKFVQFQHSPQYEEGSEYLLKAADDSLCVNDKGKPALKRVELTVNLCNIDPDGLVLVTGESLIVSGSTGVGVVYGEGTVDARFSLEVWQEVAGDAGCADGVQHYFYWAFFNVGNAMIQDYTAENAPSQLSFKAETGRAAVAWGDGPGTASWLPPGFAPTSNDHYLHTVTTVAPPAPLCGASVVS